MANPGGCARNVSGITPGQSPEAAEAALIDEFESLLSKAIPELSDTNIVTLQKDVGLYMDIRGYGPVKELAVSNVREKVAAHAIMQA